MNPKPEDVVLRTLKQRYFAIALTEEYPHTPKITRELDDLEVAIRERQKATQPA